MRQFLVGMSMILVASAATAQVYDPERDMYPGYFKVDGSKGDKITGGVDVDDGPATLYVFPGGGSDGSVGFIEIWHPFATSGSWAIRFKTLSSGKGLVPGSYDAKWQNYLSDVDGYAFMFLQKEENGCFQGEGKFTVVESKFSNLANGKVHVDKFHINYTLKCTGAEAGITGTILVEGKDPTEGDEPDVPDEGDEPEPPPPPPPQYVKFLVPFTDIFVGNAGRTDVPIATTVHEGYIGDVQLEAFGPPGLTVTFEPNVIAAPGAGSSIMTIEASEYLIPMTHVIEVRASGPPRPTSWVFPLRMECEPPVVLAANAPTSQSIGQGESVTLMATPAGSGPMRYQWYEGPRGSTWFPIEGATSASFTTPPLEGVKQYWLRITNPCGSWDSSTITLRTGSRFRGVGR